MQKTYTQVQESSIIWYTFMGKKRRAGKGNDIITGETSLS